MTIGLQPSNSMGKDLLGWKLIDINCGEKEAKQAFWNKFSDSDSGTQG